MHIFSPKKGAVVITLTMLLSAGFFAVTGYASAQHDDQLDSNQLLALDPGPGPSVDNCSDGEDNDYDGNTDYDDDNCCNSYPNSESSGNCSNNGGAGGGDDGNECTLDYPDEGKKVECDMYQSKCVSSNSDEAQEGWLDGVPACGDSGRYLTDPGECTSANNSASCKRLSNSAETETRTQSCSGDCGDDDGGGGGGACDGNTAKTISVSDYFGELDVESFLDCSDYNGPQNCDETSSNSKSASLDLSNVLGDGQTPGDLTVSFSSGEPYWSEGFTAAVECGKNNEGGGSCDAKAEITYAKDPGPSPQRSVNTEYKSHTVDNADDWVIEDIRDGRDVVTLETAVSSSIGASGDYDESASADITVDDIQLQVCGDGGGDDDLIKPPIADDDSASVDLCTAKSFTLNVLGNDKDPDDENLRIDSVGNPSGGGTASGVDTDGDGLDDAISYTPSSGPSTVKFDYTVSDGGDGTDTATVTVDVNGTKGSCQGSITVQVEDQNGNPVSVDNVDINFAGNSSCPSESNTSGYTCTVDLSDTCENGSYSISDSDYDVVGRDKAEDGDTGISSKTETCLGY